MQSSERTVTAAGLHRASAGAALAALWILVGHAMGCAASPAEGADDAEPATLVPFDCALGVSGADGTFQPLSAAAKGELMLGFQGFLVVEMVVAAGADAPDKAKGAASVTLAGEAPFASFPPPLRFASSSMKGAADMAKATQVFPLLLQNTQVGFYKGRTATISVKVSGEGRVCVATGQLLLVDEDPCVHTGKDPCCPGDPCFPSSSGGSKADGDWS